MSPSNTPATPKPHAMVSKHNELVATYFATAAAKRAAIGRRINVLEALMLEAELAGATNLRMFVHDADSDVPVDKQVRDALASGEYDYHHHESPKPAGPKKSWDKTPDELVTFIGNLVTLANDESKPDVTRKTVRAMLTQELSNADKRNVTVPNRADAEKATETPA